MKILRKVVKNLFYRYYHICPKDYQDFEYGYDGRVVGTLSENKKRYCAIYLFKGMK